MRFVLAIYGSRGDVEPFAAVGRELLRRGHDVTLAVPPYMMRFVESVGLAAVEFGPDPPQPGEGAQAAGNTAFGVIAEVMGHLSAAWAQWDATLTELAQGADLVLTGRTEQGLGANVAEHYGIAAAALHFFPSRHWRPDGLIGRIASDTEDAQRRRLGLREATDATPGPLQIQAYDEACFPEPPANPGEGLFVGALTLQLATDADQEVMSWIAEGTPPIYFGFGSAVTFPSPAETVAAIVGACAQLGERALLCAGPNDFGDIPLPESVKAVNEVSHAAVFPVCRAVVHHGGAGTTAAGLRAGVPTLILWHAVDDQPVWAAAVETLKVGLGRAFWISTGESLVADLQSILSPECVSRAREFAAEMTTAEESVARAADLLEDTARRGGSG